MIQLPAALEKLTTRPRASFTSGRNVLVTSIIPHRFTSAVRLKMSSGVHSRGSVQPIPALFTRPHNPTNILNRPFPNSLLPLFQSESSCKTFHMKMSFIYMGMKTHFHMKGYARRLALKKRYKTTRKWL